jgi:hypothetical protein
MILYICKYLVIINMENSQTVTDITAKSNSAIGILRKTIEFKIYVLGPFPRLSLTCDDKHLSLHRDCATQILDFFEPIGKIDLKFSLHRWCCWKEYKTYCHVRFCFPSILFKVVCCMKNNNRYIYINGIKISDQYTLRLEH